MVVLPFSPGCLSSFPPLLQPISSPSSSPRSSSSATPYAASSNPTHTVALASWRLGCFRRKRAAGSKAHHQPQTTYSHHHHHNRHPHPPTPVPLFFSSRPLRSGTNNPVCPQLLWYPAAALVATTKQPHLTSPSSIPPPPPRAPTSLANTPCQLRPLTVLGSLALLVSSCHFAASLARSEAIQ